MIGNICRSLSGRVRSIIPRTNNGNEYINLKYLSSQMTFAKCFFSRIPSVEGMPDPFDYKESPFNSATINAGKVYFEDTAEFATKLYSTATHLRHENKNALWLKIPLDFAHLITTANTFGFKLHHTSEKFIMMALWLKPEVPNKIPPFSTHHVGVAGIVLDDDENVLVIKEKYPNSIWKFPGGLANLGEDIGDAAAREVYEETGVQSKFQSILAFRHQHEVQFGCSDLYFACRMKVLGDYHQLKPCAHEIEDLKWVPLNEFEKENTNSMLSTLIAAVKKENQKDELMPEGYESIVPGRPPFLLYHTVY